MKTDDLLKSTRSFPDGPPQREEYIEGFVGERAYGIAVELYQSEIDRERRRAKAEAKRRDAR